MKLLKEINKQITFDGDRVVSLDYKEWELDDRSIDKSLFIESVGDYEYIAFDEKGIRDLHDYLHDILREWPIVISQEYEIAERKPESPQDARFREILRHTLGLDYQTKPFRNRYVSNVNCDSYPVLLEMEKTGLLGRARTPSFCHKDDVFFFATDKGYALVGATKEERDL